MAVSSDLLQLALIHVVLILAHADGLGIDLYQFGQRVLQTPRDGNGAAHGEVEIGKFLARDIRRRVYGRARFVHRHAEDLSVLRLEKLPHKRIGFARGGAVADGDGAHTVFGDQRFRVRAEPAMSFFGSCG